ncbi:MAG: 5'/3'-nucleotidase SurE [Anaerolineales bacterium]
MHILITNDDGIDAPGLFALAQALKQDHEIKVIAPNHNWSASGHVKTMHRPLRVKEFDLGQGIPAFSTDGAPSDCVALALLGLVDGPIDLVVSGINPNANLGHDVTYSGTVTAAMEAAISGVPGLAFSLDGSSYQDRTLDYSAAASIAAQIVASLEGRKLRQNTVLNINIPYAKREEIRGLTITRQGQRVYRDELIQRKDPKNRPYYWIGGEAPSGIADPGTDIWALSQGLVSITPLKLDLTHQDDMQALQDWDLKLA